MDAQNKSIKRRGIKTKKTKEGGAQRKDCAWLFRGARSKTTSVARSRFSEATSVE